MLIKDQQKALQLLNIIILGHTDKRKAFIGNFIR